MMDGSATATVVSFNIMTNAVDTRTVRTHFTVDGITAFGDVSGTLNKPSVWMAP